MPSSKEFLKNTIRSGLMTRDQLAASLRTLPRKLWLDTDRVAEHLIRTGKLSRFQAEKLIAGKTVGLQVGPFQILAPIGKGGISVVYLARDSRTSELVALKTFSPKRAKADNRALVRFQREMTLSRLLDHSNIAYCYEVGTSDGVHYLAMEFVHGKSLRSTVNSEGPLSVPRAAHLFTEVALAVEHAHSKGLIHRDLKPSNIMVTPDGRAKVLDFGLALVKGELELVEVIGGRGYTVGTMDYIAPEQTVDAAKVDERADLYSLGATLYFAVTGQPPFPGGNKLDKIRRHRKAKPVPVQVLVPDIDPDFAALIHKLLAKKPHHRLASATEFRTELYRFVVPHEV